MCAIYSSVAGAAPWRALDKATRCAQGLLDHLRPAQKYHRSGDILLADADLHPISHSKMIKASTTARAYRICCASATKKSEHREL